MPMEFQPEPREGELCRVVQTFGRSFELRYGYYEDCDRGGPPDVLYPNFKNDPQYTDEGYPFVTRMQDACPHYCSRRKRCPDSVCGECNYFRRGEDWFGICTCIHNRRE